MKFGFGFIAVSFICIYSIFSSKTGASPVSTRSTRSTTTNELARGLLFTFRIVVSCCYEFALLLL